MDLRADNEINNILTPDHIFYILLSKFYETGKKVNILSSVLEAFFWLRKLGKPDVITNELTQPSFEVAATIY